MVENSANPPRKSRLRQQLSDVAAEPDISASMVEMQTVVEKETEDGRETRTIRQTSAEEDSNFDGIPDKLQSFLNHSDFRMDWTRRRQLVYRVVVGLGVLFSILVLALVYLMLRERPLDGNLAGLASTMLWVISTTFIAIATAYIFGAQIDSANFRGSVNDIIANINNRGVSKE